MKTGGLLAGRVLVLDCMIPPSWTPGSTFRAFKILIASAGAFVYSGRWFKVLSTVAGLLSLKVIGAEQSQFPERRRRRPR